MSYCKVIKTLEGDRKILHATYHDLHYGFPITDDNELFGRLLLEINQAGLSWETILKKQDAFRRAYAGFNIKKVAKFTAADRRRLLADAGIIRNRLKIEAAISNAQAILELQRAHGSFLAWIEAHHPRSKDEWVKLFKRTFKFTGGEIVNEFLMSIGVLPGAHEEKCPVYRKAVRAKPLWKQRPGSARK